jgi:hypothetical protein
MNGKLEKMIDQVKKTLTRMLGNKSCSFNELETMLHEDTLIKNSRPIGVAGWECDLQAVFHCI